MADTAEARFEKLRRRLERKCQAVDLPHKRRCGQPSGGYYWTTCPDGHGRYFYLCRFHAELLPGWCSACDSAPGNHDCPLLVVPLVMGMNGWEPA